MAIGTRNTHITKSKHTHESSTKKNSNKLNSLAQTHKNESKTAGKQNTSRTREIRVSAQIKQIAKKAKNKTN